MNGSATVWRFMRYALVGVATNATGYLIYLMITFLGVAPKTAMSILYFVGAALGYIGNRKIAFRYSGSWRRSCALYILFHTGGYLINFMLLALLVDRHGYPHQLVQLFAVGIVAIYLFVTFNFFVFKSPAQTMTRE